MLVDAAASAEAQGLTQEPYVKRPAHTHLPLSLSSLPFPKSKGSARKIGQVRARCRAELSANFARRWAGYSARCESRCTDRGCGCELDCTAKILPHCCETT